MQIRNELYIILIFSFEKDFSNRSFSLIYSAHLLIWIPEILEQIFFALLEIRFRIVSTEIESSRICFHTICIFCIVGADSNGLYIPLDFNHSINSSCSFTCPFRVSSPSFRLKDNTSFQYLDTKSRPIQMITVQITIRARIIAAYLSFMIKSFPVMNYIFSGSSS